MNKGRNCSVIAISVLCTGCALKVPIETTVRTQERLIRDETKDSKDEAWTYDFTATTSRSDDQVSVSFKIGRYKACQTVRTRVVDRTEITERRGKDLWLPWVVGSAGVALTGTSLGLRYGADEPFTDPSMGDSKPTWNFYLLLGGIALSTALVPAIIGSVNAMDSEKPLGEVVERDPKTDRCDAELFANRKFTLVDSSGATLADFTTDDKGTARITLDSSAVRSQAVVRSASGEVVGTNVFSKDLLDALRGQAQKDEQERRWRENADKEVTSGKCLQGHINEMQQRIGAIEGALKSMATGTEVFVNVGNKTLVADQWGSSFKFDPTLPGNYHLFALAYQAVKISVADQAGNVITNPSRLQMGAHFAWQGGQMSSVNFHGNGKPVEVRIKGRGCVMVLGFREL